MSRLFLASPARLAVALTWGLLLASLSLLVSLEGIDLRFTYRSDRGEFSLSSGDIRLQVGDLHFSHPDIYRFIKEYLHEGLAGVARS